MAAACGPLPQREAVATQTPAPTARTASAAPLAPAPTPLAMPTGQAAVDRGADLFSQGGCLTCHGQVGEGYVGPRIARTSLSLAAVVTQVRFPVTPKMTPFSRRQLSDEEIAYIYAFLQSLGTP